MHIGIDVQSLQSTSRNRGIGRYNKNLLNNILKIDSTDQFKLFFNGNYTEDLPIKPNQNTQLIKINYRDSEKPSNRIANNLVQYFKYQEFDLDVFLLLSTFEGWPINDATITTHCDRLDCLLATVVFDFIPLHYPELYLDPHPEFKAAIYKRLKAFYHSDILFSISEWTRLDAINRLGINPKRVINISSGIDENFHHIENLQSTKVQKIKKKYHIKNRFVLYVSGIDLRKNIEKSISAFSKIGKSLLADTSYVIVCNINEHDKVRLEKIAKEYDILENVIFTGFVSDSDLNILYNCCDAFILPSLIEGLGLPLLEAMKCEAPIIASNTSSLKELVEDENYMFDPKNEEEITSKIKKMLTNNEYREKSISHSQKRAPEFSWEGSSWKLLTKIQSLKKEISARKEKNHLKKPKIAFFSPLPPAKSGISYYSASLLPFLSRYWEIDIFVDDNYVCNDPYLVSNFEIYPYFEFEKLNELKKYDEMVYHVGNSDKHTYIFDILKKYPGVVVLHDVYLSGIMYWMTARLGKLDEFVDEVSYCHGDYGKKLVKKAKQNLIPWEKVIEELQVNKRVLENATHIIVHSEWDKEKIVKLYPEFEKKISLAHQFSPIRIIPNKQEIKSNLGFSKDDFLVCSFGFVEPTKKLDSVLKNIATFLKNNKNARYVIVGDAQSSYGQSIKKLAENLDLSKKVIFTGFIEDDEYKKYLDCCDVCISLRTKARAGTSTAVNHPIGAAIPTIISDEGPFANFADVVIKVKSDEEKNLSKILDELYKDPEKRIKLGSKGQNYAQNELSIDSCVQKYVSIIDKTLKGQRVHHEIENPI